MMVLSEKKPGITRTENFQQGAAAGGKAGLLRKAAIVGTSALDAYGTNPGVCFRP
jgi:hypothetical protein